MGLQEYRCIHCKKLLFKGVLVETVIEVKCKGCSTMNTIESSNYDELQCLINPCPYRIPLIKKDT